MAARLLFALIVLLFAPEVAARSGSGKNLARYLRCKRDSECFLIKKVCGCRPCAPRWRRAGNALAVKDANRRRRHCPKVKCKRCVKRFDQGIRWLGDKARCLKGRHRVGRLCTAVHRGKRRGVWGDIKTGVFHGVFCKRAQDASVKAHFEDHWAAMHGGFRPHKACLPRSFDQYRAWRKRQRKELSCRRNSDCVFRHRLGCRCSRCGYEWRQASNRKTLMQRVKYWKMRTPVCRPCRRCLTTWLGKTPACVRGECIVKP